MKKSQDGLWPSLKKVFIPAGTIALVCIGLLGAYHTVNSFVDSKIEKAVNSEAFVKKVQTGVRPFLIFDASGKVLIDLGALEHIDPPVVISTKDNPIPEKVIVTPKEYMAHAPLITGIDQETKLVLLLTQRAVKGLFGNTNSKQPTSWPVILTLRPNCKSEVALDSKS